MRRYLIVAHKTLGGDHLIDMFGPSRAGSLPFCSWSRRRTRLDHMCTEGEVIAAARRQLQAALDRFHYEGIIADGEIGDANPADAASTVVRWRTPASSSASSCPPGCQDRRGGCTSTSPVDAPGDNGLPVTHLVADRVVAH